MSPTGGVVDHGRGEPAREVLSPVGRHTNRGGTDAVGPGHREVRHLGYPGSGVAASPTALLPYASPFEHVHHEADHPLAGYPEHWDFDEVFDSFDRGCGDFIIDLREVMAGLESGMVLMVASRDAGAPVEVPAWCRLTGHPLLEARPPFYLIRKRTGR
jgi:tRNA 2-thiouridine synthesizing protein A